MPRLLIAGLALTAVLGLAVSIAITSAGGALIPLMMRTQSTACQPAVTPVDGGPAGGAEASGTPQEQAAGLTPEARSIAQQIIAIGKQRRLPPRAWQIAIQAGKTESNLANLNHGDRDSLGIFQMRPSMGWGSLEQVTDVNYQINKFYDVLLTVPGWETMQPGDAAQAVEKSAYPERYNQWAPLAIELIATLDGIQVADAAGCTTMPAPTETAQRVLDFARAQLGKPYVWGAAGPDAFDCSGLTMRAWEAAGISIPKYSGDQYGAGIQVPLAQAQPGDLVFWGYGRRPEGIFHVGLILDPQTVLHAPQPGEPVEITKIWDDGKLLPTVIRPDVRERT